jgi:trimethylamine--corrinoid protein Co-methyltransferase
LILEQLVVDNEIGHLCRRLKDGVDSAESRDLFNDIAQVGPGGHFLRQKHTMKHLEEEHFLPKLSDRDSYEVWSEKGKKAIHERAREEVKKILSEHQPLPLDAAVKKSLAIIREVRRGGSLGQGAILRLIGL